MVCEASKSQLNVNSKLSNFGCLADYITFCEKPIVILVVKLISYSYFSVMVLFPYVKYTITVLHAEYTDALSLLLLQ